MAALWLFSGCTKEEEGVPGAASAPQTAVPAAPSAPPPPLAAPRGESPHQAGAANTAPPHAPLEGGMAQASANSVMERINLYKDRLKADPKDLEALEALGNANFDIQRFDRARDLYLRVLEIDPHKVLVRTDLASSYWNLGDTDQAYEQLNQVLTVKPEHETALYNLGVLLLNHKRDAQGAIAAWEKLIAAHPDVVYASGLAKRIEALRKDMAQESGEGSKEDAVREKG